MKKRRVRKIVQALSLGLFIFLLWQSVFPLANMGIDIPWSLPEQWSALKDVPILNDLSLPQSLSLPVDSFLRIDPLVSLLVPLAARDYIPSLIVGVILLGLALLMGRIFCGYICPMGISLDISRNILPGKLWNTFKLPKWLRQTKYIFFITLTFSALFGISHIFWGSPIALITRLYALILHPIILLLGKLGLDSIRPVIDYLDSPLLSYLQITPRVFYSVYFLTAFFGLLFLLERMRPRFWCRYLCPAGALLGFLSLRPLWRRRVHVCIDCGKCIRNCPTDAICNDPAKTKYAECITCRTCVDICPVRGISFACSTSKKEKIRPNTPALRGTERQVEQVSIANSVPQYGTEIPFIPSRRAFLCAAGSGVGIATLSLISTASPLSIGFKGTMAQSGCVRPPGARPEADFLARCIRCGQCMKVCPTNALQPTWITAGFEGVFSPVLMTRRGPCEPECAECGKVCPTQAIMKLPLQEKQQAKVGTAVVKPGLCLAWAEGRSCVVCQEVCPYGALTLQTNNTAKVPVPVVNANRCYGCGFCEKHCPVHIPAIVIYPLNALRLNTENYKQKAVAAGLDLIPVAKRTNVHGFSDDIPEGQLPPGFTE